MAFVSRTGLGALVALGIAIALPAARASAAVVAQDEPDAKQLTRADYLASGRPLLERSADRAVDNLRAEDADAMKAFVRASALVILYDDEAMYWPPEMPAPAVLLAQGEALPMADKTQPLTRWLIARNDVRHPTFPVERRHWQAMGTYGLRVSTDPLLPPALRLQAALDVYDAHQAGALDRDYYSAAWRTMFNTVADAFGPGEVLPDEQRYLIRSMFWPLRPNDETTLAPILKAAEQPDAARRLPWAGAMVRARHATEAGDEARGTGFANTVTPAAMRRFREHYQDAADYYLRALELRPNWPEPARQLGRVVERAGLAGHGTGREWLDRANALELANRGAYDTIFFYYLPRWGGSHDALLGLARDAVERAEDGPATHLPLILGDAYETVLRYDRQGEDGLKFMRGSGDWPLFDRGLARMADAARAQSDADPAEAHWRAAPIAGTHAAWAWAFGDFATARDLLASPAGSLPAAAVAFDGVIDGLDFDPAAVRDELANAGPL